MGKAQPGSKVLRIQVVDVDTRRGLSRISVSLVGLGGGVTNSDGVVRIPIPDGVSEIELQAPAGFEVLDPPGPKQPVPANEEVVIKFYIQAGRLDQLNAQLRQLTQERSQLQNELTTIRDRQDSLQQAADRLVMDRDSLATLQRRQQDRLQRLEDSLQLVQSDIRSVKLEVYRDISENYQEYLNAVLNFREVLKNVRHAFTNPQELNLFNSYVENLNETRDALHEKHLGYLQTVGAYWQANERIELEQLYDLALEEVYDEVILPLNELLVAQLRAAWNKETPRIVAQRRAKKPTKEALRQLETRLEALQRQGDRTLRLLESQ